MKVTDIIKLYSDEGFDLSYNRKSGYTAIERISHIRFHVGYTKQDALDRLNDHRAGEIIQGTFKI